MNTNSFVEKTSVMKKSLFFVYFCLQISSGYAQSSTINPSNGINISSTTGVGVQATSSTNSVAYFVTTNTVNSNPTLVVSNNSNGAVANFFKINTEGNGAVLVVQKTLPYEGAYTTAPHAELEVRHPTQYTVGMSGLRITNTGSNNNSWTFYTVNTGGSMTLMANGNNRGSFNAATGAYTTFSDARMKVGIQNYANTLDNLLKVGVKSYQLLNSEKTEIGLLAQEVIKVFPELIYTTNDDKGNEFYMMDYARIGVIAVKAIQEQQVMIDQQKLKMQEQDLKIDQQQKAIEMLVNEMHEIKKTIKTK